MFDNKTLEVQSTRETLFPRLKCVCVRARARVCVCVPARRALKLTSKVHFELRARPNNEIHTKNGWLEDYSLKQSLCLEVNKNSWEKIRCVSIFCLKVTDGCFINVNQRTKYKEKITHSS